MLIRVYLHSMLVTMCNSATAIISFATIPLWFIATVRALVHLTHYIFNQNTNTQSNCVRRLLNTLLLKTYRIRLNVATIHTESQCPSVRIRPPSSWCWDTSFYRPYGTRPSDIRCTLWPPPTAQEPPHSARTPRRSCRSWRHTSWGVRPVTRTALEELAEPRNFWTWNQLDENNVCTL